MEFRELLLKHALEYLSWGWSVIPVYRKAAFFDYTPYQNSHPSPGQLRGWFLSRHRIKSIGSLEYPDGMGVIFGKVSGGLRARDFDKEYLHLGYSRWANAHPDLASHLPTVKTWWGWQVFYRSRDLPENIFKLRDGEYRLGKGYSVLPPSSHPDDPSFRYSWDVPWSPDCFLPDPTSAGLYSPSPRAHPSPPIPHPLPPAHGITPPQGTTLSSSLPRVEGIDTKKGENWATDDRIQAAMRSSLPVEHGTRNSCLFELVRRLKGIGMKGPEACRDVFECWFSLAEPNVRTKDIEVSWTEFCAWWKCVKKPRGTLLEGVLAAAIEGPDPPGTPEGYGWQNRRLLRILFAYRQFIGGEFNLGCKRAGVLLGIGARRANQMLNRLVEDGLLMAVTKGDWEMKLETTWRYVGP